MTDNARKSDLQSRDYPIREDMVYQVKVWRFERWGWYGLILVMLLALAGLFSRGPLSVREVHGNDAKISVEYERFNQQWLLQRHENQRRGLPGFHGRVGAVRRSHGRFQYRDNAA